MQRYGTTIAPPGMSAAALVPGPRQAWKQQRRREVPARPAHCPSPVTAAPYAGPP